MSLRHRLLKRARYHERKNRCQQEGCTHPGRLCVLYDDIGGALEDRFCPEHAFDAGYCICCGEFWGGIEAFEFSPSRLCPHCADQARADSGEDLEDDGFCFDYEP